MARGVEIVEPGWDLDLPAETKAERPYLRAMTARPFLRRYFPGYGTYLWMDADTWVQDESAVELLFAAAANSSIALVPEVHPSYRQPQSSIDWRIERLNSCYCRDFGRTLHANTYFNSGVFAMQGCAPHWGLWAASMAEGVKNCAYKYISDQTALNYVIWSNRLNVHPLPAVYNWCCHLSMPGLARVAGKFVFCEPHLPHRNIGIVQMTSKTKDAQILINVGRKQQKFSLSYSGLKGLNQRLQIQANSAS